MLEVVRYNSAYKAAWDALVASSKNGTFLFLRNYMEYHAHRFRDHSLLFYNKGKLIALLPANETGQEVHSHGGLSYGGIISGSNMKAALMLRVFKALQEYYKRAGFLTLTYKCIPHIYHSIPAEEDQYALFRVGATLVRRDLNSVVDYKNRLPYSQLRKRRLKKGERAGLVLQQSNDFAEFMNMVRELLQIKYKLTPVHTVEEIVKLAQYFPEQIKLFTASDTGGLVAGTIVYVTSTVAHCQYIASSERGKLTGALDVLTDWLINEVYVKRRYFSFGVSTEQQGFSLNENLVRNKESYGARSVVHDFYELKL